MTVALLTEELIKAISPSSDPGLATSITSPPTQIAAVPPINTYMFLPGSPSLNRTKPVCREITVLAS